MEATIVDFFALLLNLIIIVICWIVIILKHKKLKKLSHRNFESQNVMNSLTIGIGSGLVVFVLGFFAGKLSFSNIDFSSIESILISLFAGVITLVFQFSILLAILAWVIVDLIFKNLIHK
jgi:hypothetical protein